MTCLEEAMENARKSLRIPNKKEKIISAMYVLLSAAKRANAELDELTPFRYAVEAIIDRRVR